EREVLVDDERRRRALPGERLHERRVLARDGVVPGVVVGRAADVGKRVQIRRRRRARRRVVEDRRREEDDVAGDRWKGRHLLVGGDRRAGRLLQRLVEGLRTRRAVVLNAEQVIHGVLVRAGQQVAARAEEHELL